jgi:uncharacterized protein
MNGLVDYLLQPPVLFFLLGVFAVLVRSDLELPAPLPKVLSIYLLVAIGLKGGLEFNKVANFGVIAEILIAALVASIVIPFVVFWIARRIFSVADAAAVAATYGSVSAVTFIAATTYLDQNQVPYGGYMVAALALMESPAILIGLVLAKRGQRTTAAPLSWGHLLHDCCTNGAVLLLVGSLLIGYLAPAQQALTLQPFLQAAFPGVLCLFVLDLGMTVARQSEALRKAGRGAIILGLAFPLVAGGLALVAAKWLGFQLGDAVLFTVLCASGSYLAVPAALRQTLPEANPGVYVTLALGVTFPFNLAVGIPLFYWLIRNWWS